jgi:hypothetical protein
MTNTLTERAAREWSQIAQQPVTVELVGGVLYAFGSELACLRLWAKMRIGKASYSLTRGTFYYTTDKPVISAEPQP